jgi:phosphoribosylformylglycinamidine synthase
MASGGRVGLDIDVSKVPLREDDMEPFEIMVSESQERMLCVVEPEKLAELEEICARWEVLATVIGTVTDSRHLRIFQGEEQVADMPVEALVDDCPLYDLAPERPNGQIYPAPVATLDSDDPQAILPALLASSNISSRLPLFEQYDCMVQSRTVRRPEQADAAVLQLAHDGVADGRAIAISIDGSGRRVACDPYNGTVEVVLECAANLACVGAEPLGLTNCLNFGNPEKPHIAWQLEQAVTGMSDALVELGVPVVGGNVSLYNQSGDGPIYPTPVVGMVGTLPDAERAAGLGFAREGDVVAILGTRNPQLAGSELAKLRGDALPDGLPAIDVAAVKATQEAVRDAVRDGYLSSAHDIAEGGFLAAVAECCLAGGIGVRLDLGSPDDPEAHLFGEAVGGFVVSAPRDVIDRLAASIPVDGHGTVGGDRLEVGIAGNEYGWSLDELRQAHGALAGAFA